MSSEDFESYLDINPIRIIFPRDILWGAKMQSMIGMHR